MYYGMVMIAVTLFGLQFFCNQKYQQACGSGLASTMTFLLGSNIVGLAILLCINKFQVGTTPFTLAMALVATLNGVACTFCSLKALSRINLSLFSLFNMLGGMALPFCAGILFFGEALTLPKALCLLIIAGAMLITVERGSKKGGGWYYAGIFVFNGMSGVISTFYQTADFAKANEASFSIWGAAVTAVLAAVVLLCMKNRSVGLTLRPAAWMAGFGILNKIGNFLLLLALVHLPASVQYPMVTGGVIIVSTLLSYITPKKPSKRELIATAVSFIGILILVI